MTIKARDASTIALLGAVNAPRIGTIKNANRVRVKPSPEDPEMDYANAEVRLYRVRGGRMDWVGRSDASGRYYPVGLIEGAAYIPVAIDASRQYECVAAGPVVAERDDA